MRTKVPAQILALTLLTIFLISMIAVAVFNIATRDLQQTIANSEYQRLLNSSETRIFDLIDKYSSGSTALSQLPNDFPGQCNLSASSTYTCNFASGNVSTRTVVQETTTVQNYTLDKDQYLELNVSGYTGNIIFSYSGGTAALEFNLLYANGGSTFAIQDIFDPSAVLTSNGGDPLSDPSSNHAYPFATFPGSEYVFRISNISGFPVGGAPSRLRITVRKAAAGAVSLNVRGEAGFPNQVRVFTANSYDTRSNIQVAASANAQVPLLTQSLGLFDYALLVNNNVVKEAATF